MRVPLGSSRPRIEKRRARVGPGTSVSDRVCARACVREMSASTKADVKTAQRMRDALYASQFKRARKFFSKLESPDVVARAMDAYAACFVEGVSAEEVDGALHGIEREAEERVEASSVTDLALFTQLIMRRRLENERALAFSKTLQRRVPSDAAGPSRVFENLVRSGDWAAVSSACLKMQREATEAKTTRLFAAAACAMALSVEAGIVDGIASAADQSVAKKLKLAHLFLKKSTDADLPWNSELAFWFALRSSDAAHARELAAARAASADDLKMRIPDRPDGLSRRRGDGARHPDQRERPAPAQGRKGVRDVWL